MIDILNKDSVHKIDILNKDSVHMIDIFFVDGRDEFRQLVHVIRQSKAISIAK